jgi:HPt (histidine-containing phosphotransfer) domain-containing protein
MSQSEEDFMAELKREFQDTIKNNLRDFPKMMADGRFEDIARIAHDIKGNAALFELAEGSQIAARLQQAAQKRDGAQTATLIGELGAYMKGAGIAD